ncbi:MAG: YdcH family protein [Propionivibrio sp.]
MQVEHHELHREFPEFLDVMQVLRSSDSRFSEMFDQYHSLTSEVERLEEVDVPVDDFTIEQMKKVRVNLKDKMYQILVAHKNSN